MDANLVTGSLESGPRIARIWFQDSQSWEEYRKKNLDEQAAILYQVLDLQFYTVRLLLWVLWVFTVSWIKEQHFEKFSLRLFLEAIYKDSADLQLIVQVEAECTKPRESPSRITK